MWPSSSLPDVLYPLPASAFVTAMSVVSFLSLAFLGLSELRGEHLAYSKFWHIVSSRQKPSAAAANTLLSSRLGMLVAYTPALAAAAVSFAVPGLIEGLRAQILAAALAVHFLKRVLEVLFIHRYSGNMTLNTTLVISSSYMLSTVTMIYAQHLAVGLPDPPINLLYTGMLLFAVGSTGNFYHHYLLSQLRKGGDDDKGYKIPRGGLFEIVTCPHYLFEITSFFGFVMISQMVYPLAMAFGTACYLVGRSFATRRWYRSKFEEFPARIKALVPYIL